MNWSPPGSEFSSKCALLVVARSVHFWFRRKFLVSMPWYEPGASESSGLKIECWHQVSSSDVEYKSQFRGVRCEEV